MPKTILGVSVLSLSESLVERNTPTIPTNFWGPEMQRWIQLMQNHIGTDYTQTGIWTEVVGSVKQGFLNALDSLQGAIYGIGFQKMEELSQGNTDNNIQ